uniref:Uncharacterized protein n=1 Tax=Arundo donax TaxID=35708 RepID=A0A0A9BVP0_ARUDO
MSHLHSIPSHFKFSPYHLHATAVNSLFIILRLGVTFPQNGYCCYSISLCFKI